MNTSISSLVEGFTPVHGQEKEENDEGDQENVDECEQDNIDEDDHSSSDLKKIRVADMSMVDNDRDSETNQKNTDHEQILALIASQIYDQDEEQKLNEKNLKKYVELDISYETNKDLLDIDNHIKCSGCCHKST
jgi:hypothetical protein